MPQSYCLWDPQSHNHDILVGRLSVQTARRIGDSTYQRYVDFSPKKFSTRISESTIQGFGDSLIQSVVGDSRDRVLGRNPDKSLQSSPPCFTHSPLYSFALRFFFSSNSHNLLQFLQSVSVHCKGERRKT